MENALDRIDDRSPASDIDIIRSIRTFSQAKNDEFALAEKTKRWNKLDPIEKENVFRKIDGLEPVQKPVKAREQKIKRSNRIVILA